MVRIFVGNLGTQGNESLLRSVFESYGTVKEVSVMRNYAFVVMASQAEAERALHGLRETSWFLHPQPVVACAEKMAA